MISSALLHSKKKSKKTIGYRPPSKEYLRSNSALSTSIQLLNLRNPKNLNKPLWFYLLHAKSWMNSAQFEAKTLKRLKNFKKIQTTAQRKGILWWKVRFQWRTYIILREMRSKQSPHSIKSTTSSTTRSWTANFGNSRRKTEKLVHSKVWFIYSQISCLKSFLSSNLAYFHFLSSISNCFFSS